MQPPQTRKRRWLKFLTTTVITLAVIVAGVWFWFHQQFPYGLSHACSKGVGLALRGYANDHSGWLPYGGSTPEQSLSLICSNGDPYGVRTLLRGKHLSQAVVDAALANDGVLSPASCGWHYVEGLAEHDNPALAVAWDKVSGLDHNGGKRHWLEREVVMLDGSSALISKDKWPSFCATQRMLLAELKRDRTTNDPTIRWSDEAALGPNTVKPLR